MRFCLCKFHLNSVSMMYIPVQNQNSLDVMRFECVLSGHSHIVQHAEAVSLVSLSVMAGRSNHSQAFLGFILEAKIIFNLDFWPQMYFSFVNCHDNYNLSKRKLVSSIQKTQLNLILFRQVFTNITT